MQEFLKCSVTEDKLRSISEEIIQLVLAKNHDYGDAWQKHGLAGVLVRLSDKALRYERLISGHEALVVSESATDTLSDMIGYCLLGLLHAKENKQRADD